MTSEERIYFPVDQPLTQAQMNRLTLHQLQTRDVNDPKYAGFDRHFNWHDYIDLDINRVADANDVIRAVTKAMDQIAATPEGQQSIRQAYALRQHIHARFGGPQKITIDDDIAIINAQGSVGSVQRGQLSINMMQAKNNTYSGTDGKRHPYSLDSILFHELGHFKDAFNLPENRATYRASHVVAELDRERDHFNAGWESVNHALQKGGLPEKEHSALLIQKEQLLAEHKAKIDRQNSVTEYPVIIDTNHFAGHYFNEPARILKHDDFKMRPWYDILPPQGMDGDQVHVDFVHPPQVPMSKPGPNRSGPHR